MARQINRLSARAVATLTKPGRHADGGGLYLVVDKGGAKRWAFLYRSDGKLREMGLGGVLAVTLAQARQLAAEARGRKQSGIDPIAAKKERTPTFGEAADAYITAHKSGWKNGKHIAQWKMTLGKYASPLRGKQVHKITTDDVLAVLAPIWTEKPETASRLRGRIEKVLDAAKAAGRRSGENPARWRGHLDRLLVARKKAAKVNHHAAMPFDRLPAFMADLRGRSARSARSLEFLILTAARTGEVIGARWPEIDLEEKVWTVPAERMKSGREHRVPLPARAVAILREMQPLREADDGHIFPGPPKGRKTDNPQSNMAMAVLLQRMSVDVTVHGFRSSFRDWCGEKTSFPREIAEAALAHVIENKAEAAYRRGDALAKRRKLMDAWATFCASVTSKRTEPERPESHDQGCDRKDPRKWMDI